ncbi:MAG: recombination mediator RecR [Alphaproteobacteria bacterium]|nr:recombination mediator RecR [Alphaproteobacteria bacterium]
MARAAIGSEIEKLIRLFSGLPGLGLRSARRVVLYLIKREEQLLRPLSRALEMVADSIKICSCCGNIDTTDPCCVCIDPKRDLSVICVVEDVSDLWALERARVMNSHYHVLGGVLSALDGISPHDLNIKRLIERACVPEVQEILLAVNSTVEGHTTAHYITDILGDCNVRVSRLAQGIPVGGELDYLDDGTLAAAINARTIF